MGEENEERMDSILRELDESIFQDAEEDVQYSSPPSLNESTPLPTHSTPVDHSSGMASFDFESPSLTDVGDVVIEDIFLSCDPTLDDLFPEITWLPGKISHLNFYLQFVIRISLC